MPHNLTLDVLSEIRQGLQESIKNPGAAFTARIMEVAALHNINLGLKKASFVRVRSIRPKNHLKINLVIF